MAAEREAKKAALDPSDPKSKAKGSKEPKKSKGAKKVEIREDILFKILYKSREYVKEGLLGGKKASEMRVEVAGLRGMPLVQVGSVTGSFDKGEIAAARTVAGHVLKVEKREQKAKKGEKKKAWKAKKRAGPGPLRRTVAVTV